MSRLLVFWRLGYGDPRYALAPLGWRCLWWRLWWFSPRREREQLWAYGLVWGLKMRSDETDEEFRERLRCLWRMR